MLDGASSKREESNEENSNNTQGKQKPQTDEWAFVKNALSNKRAYHLFLL